MRNPGGYGVTVHAAHDRKDEEDTITCCHCNAIVVVLPPGTSYAQAQVNDPRVVEAEQIPFCHLCMKPTCRACAGRECTPFMKRVELAEAKARQRQAMFG